LGPDDSVMCVGRCSSIDPRLEVDFIGLPRLREPAGFAVVAPDGTVTDRAGEAGAAADLREGTGVALRGPVDKVRHAAYVRRVSSDGTPVDTNDNANDFEFVRLYTMTPTLATKTSGDIALCL